MAHTSSTLNSRVRPGAAATTIGGGALVMPALHLARARCCAAPAAAPFAAAAARHPKQQQDLVGRRRHDRCQRVAAMLPRSESSPGGSPASTVKQQQQQPTASRTLTLRPPSAEGGRAAPLAPPATVDDAAGLGGSGSGSSGADPTTAAPRASALGAAWERLPSRYKVLSAAFLSFVICNMDKVNMSVAIIPMAADFGWSPAVAGLVQSAFFWGYILSQLPGGYLSSRYGGRRTLPAGVAMWSAATAAVPLLAGTLPGLCLSRAAVGLGEAAAPSAATDMAARIVPPEERSSAVAFVFAGLHFGSIAGLLAAPWLIEHLGWPSVFFAFGAAGLAWTVWFEALMARLAEDDPDTAAALTANRLAVDAVAGADGDGSGALTTASSSSSSSSSAHSGGGHAGPLSGNIPWRAFLRSRSVRALAYTHFCNNWFHYTMLAWLPTYFVDTLSVDLMHAAQTALLPPLAGIAASAVAGPAVDALVARGTPLAVARKGAQCVAFLVPTACLTAAAAAGDALSPTASVALVTAALGVSSFSLAGLYCTHQDLSPKYASALLGLTNVAGAVPGIVGVAATGVLFDATGSWAAALFVPTSAFLVTGAAAYALAGSNSPEDFDAPGLDAPFAFEAPARRWLAALRGGGGGGDDDDDKTA